jgi:hypothetical protein
LERAKKDADACSAHLEWGKKDEDGCSVRCELIKRKADGRPACCEFGKKDFFTGSVRAGKALATVLVCPIRCECIPVFQLVCSRHAEHPDASIFSCSIHGD